jgi:hypothetical protein
VAVRAAHRARGGADRAGVAQGAQQIDQRIGQLGAALARLLVGREAVFEVDAAARRGLGHALLLPP